MFYDSPDKGFIHSDKQQPPDSLYKSFLSWYPYTYIRSELKRLRENVREFKGVSRYITMYLYQLKIEGVSNLVSSPFLDYATTSWLFSPLILISSQPKKRLVDSPDKGFIHSDKQQHPDSLYKSFLRGYPYAYIRSKLKRLREHVREFQRVSCYITMYLYQFIYEGVSNIISQSNTPNLGASNFKVASGKVRWLICVYMLSTFL